MQRTAFLVVLAALCVLSTLTGPVNALNFYSPTIQGQKLDFCPTLSSKPEDCGLPAADAYCQAWGYDRATIFTGPVPAPPGNKTLTIKSRESCTSSTSKACQTFGMIYCIREKLFVRPMVQGKLLDWCLQGKQGCGKEAADDFCVKQGYSHGAWSYGGPYSPRYNSKLEGGSYTYQPRSGRSCNAESEECLTFSSISCEK